MDLLIDLTWNLKSKSASLRPFKKCIGECYPSVAGRE